MEATDTTRTAAKALTAILCLVALVLIVAIVSGDQIDNDSARAVGMAVALAVFSLSGAAGLRLLRARPRLGVVGAATVALALAGFASVAALLWGDLDGEDGRRAGAAIVLALASGQLSLLLGSARAGDSDGLRALRGGVIACLATLTLMAVVELAEGGEQLDWRLFGIVAVLYLVGSVLLPVVRHSSPAAPQPAGAADLAPAPAGIDHVVVAVSDRRRADWFYAEVLGGTIEQLGEGRVGYRFGEQRLNVHAPGTAAAPLAAEPVRPGNSDLCLVWHGTAQGAAEHLRRRGVPTEGPFPRQGARGAGQSVYCRDPDGSLVELISYA